MEIPNELCPIGQELWENSSGENYDNDRYRQYVSHIKVCEICRKGLEIDEIIDEEELEPLHNDL